MRNDHLNPIEIAAFQALLEATNLLQQRLGQQLKQDGDISPPQFEILAHVAKAPEGLRMRDIADRAVHSRSGITYQVTQLEKVGLVKRRGDADDERGVVVTATAKGAKLMQRVLPRHLELLREDFFSVVENDDLETLRRILSRVAAHLRGGPRSSSTAPSCSSSTRSRTTSAAGSRTR